MGVNSLPKTVTRQRRSCDLNPGPTAPESSTRASLTLDGTYFRPTDSTRLMLARKVNHTRIAMEE